MCTLFRASIIEEVLGKIPHNWMVLGSDYPIPVDNMAPKFVETLTLQEYLAIPIMKTSSLMKASADPWDIWIKKVGSIRRNGN